MRQRTVIKTTLGDLIVALTDEVMPIVRDSADAYMVVSWVLKDVLTHRHLRDHKQSYENTKGDGVIDKAPPSSCRRAIEVGELPESPQEPFSALTCEANESFEG